MRTPIGDSTVDEALVAEHPEQFKFLKETEGSDGFKKWTTKVYETDLVIGGEVLKNVAVVAIDLKVVKTHIGNEVRAIVGFNAYMQYNWLIDYQNKKWALWR